MIDSHCHLDRLDLSSHTGSLDVALAEARSLGVKGFLCIGIGFDRAAELIE
ncbi:MAG: hydrolase TatD, partial [Pseudomonadales bacterium]